MIVVDCKVASLDMCYTFKLNEKRTAGALTEEMLELIGRKTGETGVSPEGFVLYDRRQGTTLRPSVPLGEQGVADGSELLLV